MTNRRPARFSTSFWCASFVFLICCLRVAATTPQAPMRQQAQLAAQRPMKVAVRPLAQGTYINTSVTLEVALLDANNQPVRTNSSHRIDLELLPPSHKLVRAQVIIQPGQSSERYAFLARESGLIRVSAHDADKDLLGGSNSILIRSAPAHRARVVARPKTMRFDRGGRPVRLRLVAGRAGEPLPKALPEQAPVPGVDIANLPSPKLMLSLTGGEDDLLADGKDAARLSVYYIDPDGKAAPSAIRVWLTWNHGQLIPQPLVIKKGEFSAEALLTSHFAVDSTVTLVTSSPKIDVIGEKTLTARFVPPIYGIAVQGPKSISLIDAQNLMVQFFDAEGRTIQTTKAREVTVVGSNALLRLKPVPANVKPAESQASIYVLPTWWGRTELDVSTPGYQHVTYVVEVTAGLVILLCLVGGAIGGVCAFKAMKGSWAWRIFSGLVGGLMLTWLCVYAVLPTTNSLIAHNRLSVFVVSILGGYMGIKTLDFAVKKLHLA